MMPCDAGATLQRRGDCMLQASFLRRLSGRASDDVNVSREGTKEVSWWELDERQRVLDCEGCKRGVCQHMKVYTG